MEEGELRRRIEERVGSELVKFKVGEIKNKLKQKSLTT